MKSGICLVFCLQVAALLSGCAQLTGGMYRNADASDAAYQAGGESVRVSQAAGRVDNDTLHLDASTFPMMLDMSFSESTRANGYGVEYSRIHYSSGLLTNGEFISIYHELLNLDRTTSYGYRFVYGTYTVPDSGPAGGAITAPNSLSIDGFLKGYGDSFSFVTSPYLLGSVGIGTLNWDYRVPVTDTSGYTFSHDSLDFMELKAGIGGEIGRPGVFQISVYAGPVGRIYIGRTSQGFHNDMFQNSLDVTWGATLGLRF